MPPESADQRPPRLRRLADEFADLFENAAVGLFSMAADGTVLHANRAVLDLLGCTPDDCVGRPVHAFHADPEVADDLLERLKAGEDVRGLRVRLRRKDGSLRRALLDCNAQRDDGVFRYARCCVHDMTAHERAEEAHRLLTGQLARDLADTRRLQDISAQLIGGDAADTLYDRLLDAAMEIMRSDMASMHVVDGDGALRLLAWRGFGPHFAQDFALSRADANTVCSVAWQTGLRVVVRDILDCEFLDDTPTLQELRRHGIRAVQSTPLVARDGRVLGMLSTHWRIVHEPAERGLRLLDVLARQAADLIGHRHWEQALQRQTERLQLLWKAASVLLSADDPDGIVRDLLAEIGPHLGVDAAFNYVLESSGDGLRLGSCIGVPIEAVQHWVESNTGRALCGAARAPHTEMVAGIQQSEAPDLDLLRTLGFRCCVCTPLLSGTTLLGTLAFASRSKDRFDAEELAFLQTVCHYVTLAYERLRLLHRLRDADRSKDEFLATLAHELRNTLAPIRNAVQLLHRADGEDPQLRWSRDMIERQVRHLGRLIDDLLDLSRIARNKLEFRRERIELSGVIADAVESSRLFIEEHGHELSVSVPPHPVYLHGDALRLAQVLVNLLHNAAKYTEPGGRIGLTAQQLGDTVELRVSDSGVGIPPDNLPRLFQMFFQADRSLERSQRGLGIGLSLVRHLVDRHGGSVEAHSDGIGKGSEFTVRLPVLSDAATAPPPRPASEQAAAAAAVCHQLLVADDNADAADSLAMLLRLHGKAVHTAYDGLAAVEAAARLQPDAVVLDIGMPNLDGHEACRRIRAQAPNRHTVIVALTGWDQPRDRQRTQAAGFDAHLVKPVDPAALLELIDRLLAERPGGTGAGDNAPDAG